MINSAMDAIITVDQQQISDVGAVTISEVLANVPAITGMGNSGRGSNGNGGAGASVYIHQIGDNQDEFVDFARRELMPAVS